MAKTTGLEKAAMKQRLVRGLRKVANVTTPKIMLRASHTSNPTRPMTKMNPPSGGVQGAMHKVQGATDSILRYQRSRNTPPGVSFKPPSSTNVGIKTGPLSFGASLSGGKPKAIKVGLSGNFNKNFGGRASVKFPIGGGKPYYSAGLHGRF